MSRIDRRHVRVEAPGREAFDLPCLWIPRSGDKVLALWRVGGAPAGSRVVSEGTAWRVARIVPNDDVTEAATLEPEPAA